MPDFKNLSFVDNPAISGRPDHYLSVTVSIEKVLKSWRLSLFSHEWLTKEGSLKNPEDLPAGEQVKKQAVDSLLQHKQPVEKPVLGIGLLDNVEIGIGRATFLTLAAYGLTEIPVHIPKSNSEEFKKFCVNGTGKGEAGNVFIYILIAIALLAALSFAIMQGSRSPTQGLEDDRVELLVTDMLDYGQVVKTAVSQLRLRRVAVNNLSFAHPDLNATYGTYNSNPANEIFNPSGGGILYQPPPADALVTPGDYIFTAGNEVKGIHKTCGADGCADLLMISPPVLEAICLALNDRLGITNPSEAPPVDSALELSALYDGTITYSETIGDEAGSAGLEYQAAGCVEDDSTGNYHFYQVLLPR